MRLLGIYCSPRKGGNTDLLMKEFLRGCAEAGADTRELFARDLKISPCTACDSCIKTGRCWQRDDYDTVLDELNAADAAALATPVHFYSVSSLGKILIDRIQCRWNQKYVRKDESVVSRPVRPAALLAVGATNGEKLFDGLKLTVSYFFDAAGFKLERELLVRGVDARGDIAGHTDAMRRAFDMGAALVEKNKNI
jgi:multimeric flavodoxin WrbA